MRKFYLEMGAVAVGQQRDAAAMGLDIFIDDRQADAGAAHRVLRLALAAIKRLEHAGPIAVRYARSLVAHVDAGAAGLRRQLQPDRAAARREADGIRQQVADGGAQLLA